MGTRIAALVASVVVGTSVAATDDIGGHYKMEGTTTFGSTYTGTADITMTSESNCRIVFSDGYSGICLLKGTTLAVSYLVHGKAGLTLYEIAADGTIEGVFIDDYHGGGLGKEKLTRIP